ncbi:MAG TPA: DUF58 domain-containing protein [Thermoanaerobaculia bacterium]|nr:DUF58 domain-containing protein [Thermoanaerobaculia bacterium]HUM30966.1 DUF58 domain-containing protein [Thermoanaerobaculia bacterium]HXK69374.1 DUF58 domain-containing protein [Thermoanaerobaculia bacterium]
MTTSTSEILKRIRRIEIRTRRLVNDSLAGEYHSMFKGRGMEFSEVREYQRGDDVRAIDWNVTARMGSPFVKQFVEERELTVHILFDASASGLYGSFGQRKKDMAAEVSALLAFSAISNQDKVGLIIFSDEVETYIPPKKGREHVLRLIREVLMVQPRGRSSNLQGALSFLGKITTKRSVVFLLSDFFTSGYERTLTVLNRKHDIVAVSIRDGLEQDPPSVGLVRMRDLETGSEILVDTSDPATRQRYLTHLNAIDTATRSSMTRADVDLLELRADQPYEKPLTLFFAARARGIRV